MAIAEDEEVKQFGESAQTIRSEDEKRSDSELFEDPETAPMADIPALEKIGPGRQRRYEELGKDGIESVREVVLFRHEFGRHWPGMSEDMEAYYEFYYFKKPKKGEKYYDRHVKCWERRVRWIGDDKVKPASNSSKIVPLRRANG